MLVEILVKSLGWKGSISKKCWDESENRENIQEIKNRVGMFKNVQRNGEEQELKRIYWNLSSQLDVWLRGLEVKINNCLMPCVMLVFKKEEG